MSVNAPPSTFSERLRRALRKAPPASSTQPLIEQRLDIETISDPMERALLCPIKTMADMKNYFEQGLGGLTPREDIMLPEITLTEGHTSPLRMCFELYCLARGVRDDGTGLPMSEEEMIEAERQHLFELLWHGPRGGSKTYGAGGVILKLNLDEGSYGWVHTAAEKQQADRIHDYMKVWILENERSPLRSHLKGKPTRNRIAFKNDSELLFVTGSTEEGVNSAHKNGFSYDEIEVADLPIVEEAMGIPQATRRGNRVLPAIVLLLSTQKQAGRTMSHFIKKGRKKPAEINYYKWNWLEVSEPCSPSRRRNLPPKVRCADYGTNATLIAQLESRSFLSNSETEQLDTLRYYQEKLQSNCALVSRCEGKAIQARGFMPIQTTIQRLHTMKPAKFDAQMQCSRPSPEGMVYPDFGEENVTEEAGRVDGAPIIGMLDHGYAEDPVAMNIACIHDSYFDVYWEQQIRYKIKIPALARLVLKITEEMGVDEWVIDNQLHELLDEMLELGINADRAPKRPVEEGVKKVSTWILSEGFRAMRFHPCCRDTIESMWNYRRNTKGAHTIPRAQDDHHPDCIRYGVQRVEDGLLRSSGVEYGRRGLGRSR